MWPQHRIRLLKIMLLKKISAKANVLSSQNVSKVLSLRCPLHWYWQHVCTRKKVSRPRDPGYNPPASYPLESSDRLPFHRACVGPCTRRNSDLREGRQRP